MSLAVPAPGPGPAPGTTAGAGRMHPPLRPPRKAERDRPAHRHSTPEAAQDAPARPEPGPHYTNWSIPI